MSGSKVLRTSMTFKNVTHVLFDMDGLLLDTEKFYTEAFQNILEPFGKTFTWEIKCAMMGLQREEAALYIIQKLGLPLTCQELLDLSQEQYQRLMPHAELLPDTEGIYEGMVRDICLKYNKRFTKEVRMKILGTTEQRTAQIAVQDMKLPIDASEFRRQYSELAKLRLQNAPLLEGAERLLRHLYMNKVPIALATSSGDESVEIKIQNYKELFGLFNHMVMGSTDSEVKEGKPAPDIFLVCASRFPDKPDPEQCLVFEDAPNGVLAAVSAGMQVVMVPDTKLTDEQKSRATLVITSLLDFKPEVFGLPPFPIKEQVAVEE